MGFQETFDRAMCGGFDGVTSEERDRAVRDLVEVASVAGAAVSLQPVPIPFLDTALLIPIHVGLVQAIGRVYGHTLDRKTVIEMLGTFGVSLVSQHVIRSAVRLIPGLGWVVGASMGYAMTYAIGDVADHYFRTGRGVTAAELKSRFERTYQAKRTEKEAAHADDRSLKRKLEQIKDAFDGGLLSPEEYARMKEQILAGF